MCKPPAWLVCSCTVYYFSSTWYRCIISLCWVNLCNCTRYLLWFCTRIVVFAHTLLLWIIIIIYIYYNTSIIMCECISLLCILLLKWSVLIILYWLHIELGSRLHVITHLDTHGMISNSIHTATLYRLLPHLPQIMQPQTFIGSKQCLCTQ